MHPSYIRRARACPSPCLAQSNDRGGNPLGCACGIRGPPRYGSRPPVPHRRARACPSPCFCLACAFLFFLSDRGGQAPALRYPGRFLSPALRCAGRFLSPALRGPRRFMHAHYLIPTRIDDFDGHLPMQTGRKWQRYRPTQLLKTFRINDTLQRTRNF